MKIIVGENAGFCYGVKNAVTKTLELSEKNPDGIYCLGELVHNKQVNEELAKRNVKIVNNINEVKDKTIIRAHGVEKEIYEIAEQKGIELFDYTCPNVLNIHKIIEEYEKDNYFIFLVGIKNHPETIGSYSYCGKNAIVIENIEEIEKAIEMYNKSNLNKALLIVQTTYKKTRFDEIKNILRNKIKDNLIIKNTICNATRIRQEETRKIAQEVEAMIIIGGTSSSNTKKLAEVAKEECEKVYLVETYNDLILFEENLKFIEKFGIMAGASTPKQSIDDIINYLSRLDRGE